MCKQKLREAGISLRPTEPSSGTPDPTSTGRRRRVFCPAQSVPRTNGQRSPTMQANPDLGFRQSGEHRIVGGNLRPQALMPSSRTPQGTPRAGRRCFRNCRANTSRESGATAHQWDWLLWADESALSAIFNAGRAFFGVTCARATRWQPLKTAKSCSFAARCGSNSSKSVKPGSKTSERTCRMPVSRWAFIPTFKSVGEPLADYPELRTPAPTSPRPRANCRWSGPGRRKFGAGGPPARPARSSRTASLRVERPS